ncbi:MAG: tetratricopeptide repeat protein, partial [Verrucomicrobia bacterium]|nr:tetratricopeptide repeat protein [Verrucomicrobiota bacterium]
MRHSRGIMVGPTRIAGRRAEGETNHGMLMGESDWRSVHDFAFLRRMLMAGALGLACLSNALAAGDNLPVLPPEAEAYASAGIQAFNANKLNDARTDFFKVTEMVPNHPMAWVNLGSVEYRLNDLDDAESHLLKATRLDPTIAQAWLTLGIIAYQKNDFSLGLAALSQAAYLEPDNARTHLYLGVLARKQGWLDAAEAELSEAAKLDEN